MMLQIEIDHLNKHYGGFHALKDVNISIKQGSFVALVGPSGCGKSTLLRTLAGLEKTSSGDVRIAGRSVIGKPPRERDVAMVFQSYALYPHMDVEHNMNYSMRLKRRPKEEISERTRTAAETLGLGNLLDRLPKALSGGQRQRVAMGRAIVRNPKVFLFDEPLSNLDAALRVHMRSEIRKLHERLNATSVYVTHDQVEAMTMADHVVVMRAGVVEQQGSPLDLYDRPANRFVAGFIGSPAMNFLPATATENGALVLDNDSTQIGLNRHIAAGCKFWIGMRPEHLSLKPCVNDMAIDATVTGIESTGSMTFVVLEVASQPVVLAHSGRPETRRGDQVRLHISLDNLHLFDRETELAA
ncbi:multiple sugar transport system ATP-binding protein [Phyllobacterium trifolii]|jgi:multiple sugar transport system ATP-binding protein|uniref:Multiple sugar transport system ATP-binding protein n=1 Tax=Phyllobacterium trifolii TaxID=300193 RepID=A0A839U148_9HYPH|nr:sn-glycerol-3-phosphate ABC transporter ATP-binding protein UgpC [Phyllobacterium trifolii]MBB3144177.1 multiple sugar transport system ATP-binding protein [Phyllobacterium trifolii]